MKRLIPGRTKVNIELFKGVSLTDMAVAAVALVLLALIAVSNLLYKIYLMLAVVFVAALLLVRVDEDEGFYKYLVNIARHLVLEHRFKKADAVDEPIVQRADEPQPAAEEDAFELELGEPAEAEQVSEENNEDMFASEEGRKKAARKLFAAEKKQGGKGKKKPGRKQKPAESAQKYPSDFGPGADVSKIIAFTDIQDGLIVYDGKYYGAAIEIPPVEFRFFSASRRRTSIENGVAPILRSLQTDLGMNIVKIDRPIRYEAHLQGEYDKLEELRLAYEKGTLTEEELKARCGIIYDRIKELQRFCGDGKVIESFYYIVLFGGDRNQLNQQVSTAIEMLRGGEINATRLDSRGLALMLRYSNELDFEESELDDLPEEEYAHWAMPRSVIVKPRTVSVSRVVTHNFTIVGYPTIVTDAWLAGVMSIPSTKVVVKCSPMDRAKAINGIDRSIHELQDQYQHTGITSKQMELQSHIDTLGELLATLQQQNESLLQVNVYVTAYDVPMTEKWDPAMAAQTQRIRIANMKQTVRRIYRESGMKLNHMEFEQTIAFIGGQISGYDPLAKKGRGIPSNTIAAMYPWVYAHVNDAHGIKLGTSEGVPVMIDFFRRDSERVNSNMVIVGKSGSGKSYATKSLLANLAADDAKIFVLDPENEYTEMAANLHGKFINVGNATQGRLNPFHIITALEDDEAEAGSVSGSYATHMQFLEEFFKQILPDCEKDALEYLNMLVDRMYTNHGITAETSLGGLTAEDYPIFDDLYDEVLKEFQYTDSEYIRTMLRTLINYISKFSGGGRNANIWNGPSTVTTEENFTVFNFQSLLSNRNATIANAQMLLVLKYIDNEIIKNREYNLRNHMNRKIIVVIDEAHVFIDSKFPIALDFMFQLAKRIRKYNGMQIVITQNIKDFVGSEEIARKSTAIINACQYSFIFSLAPNDMDDLCKLYEKAGGINENEQEQIVSAPRGQAFTVMSPTSRSTFKVEVPQGVVDLFQEPDYTSGYFIGNQNDAEWEAFLADSRAAHEEARSRNRIEQQSTAPVTGKNRVTLIELTEEESEQLLSKADSIVSAQREAEAASAQEEEDLAAFAEELRMELGTAETEAPVEQAPAVVQSVPAPVPQQVVVQTADRSEELQALMEQMGRLVDTMGRFSYDAMLREMDRRMEQQAAATAAAMQSSMEKTPMPEPTAAEAEPFAPEAKEQADYSETEDTTQDEALPVFGEEAEEPAEAEVARFDVLGMVYAQAEEAEETSPIEEMEAYGVDILHITLEDLALYNSRQSND